MSDAKSAGVNAGLGVCITGGSGFLGMAIVRELLGSDSPFPGARISVYDLLPPDPEIAGEVSYIRGDVRDEALLREAFAEADVVFHAAAVVDWGTRSPREVHSVNVDGTTAVLRACRRAGVRVLVFTSSLDATFCGRNLVDVDEELPYPSRHPNMYCRSKREAELAVNAAHSQELRTCSLRPADIFGEGDPYHMPPLLDMARKGFYVRIGDGSALSQHAYVGNVAVAHLQAAAAFLNGSDAHGGRSYFITDSQPKNFFHFFDHIVESAGYRIRPGNLRIPFALMYALGAVVELVTLPIRPLMTRAPRVSRFAAIYTCTTYTFRADRAAKDFGFTPKYSEADAIARTISYYRQYSPATTA